MPFQKPDKPYTPFASWLESPTILPCFAFSNKMQQVLP